MEHNEFMQKKLLRVLDNVYPAEHEKIQITVSLIRSQRLTYFQIPWQPAHIDHIRWSDDTGSHVPGLFSQIGNHPLRLKSTIWCDTQL